MTIRKNIENSQLPNNPSIVNKINVIHNVKKTLKINRFFNKIKHNSTKFIKKLHKKIMHNKKHIGLITFCLGVFLTTILYTNSVLYEKPTKIKLTDEVNVIKKTVIKVEKKIIKEKKHTIINCYAVPVKTIEDNIRIFVTKWFGKDDPVYIEKVVKAYMKLLNDEKVNKQNVLYYIALCSRESNFRMSSRSVINGSAAKGAVGISQIRPSVWAETIKDNYGISREELYTDIYKNIYAGYKIWDNYRRKGDGSILSANTGYLGGCATSYTNDINKRYVSLMSSIMRVLNEDTKEVNIRIN